MLSINYLVGDATCPVASGNKIIAHVCNDIGAWGKGFVLALSKVSPVPERAFREWYQGRRTQNFALGEVQFVALNSDTWVANMIGQHLIIPKNGIPPIRYDAIESSLGKVRTKAHELAASVHMPRIGCGLAGGEWSRIEPVIHRQLTAQGIQVFVYDLPR